MPQNSIHFEESHNSTVDSLKLLHFFKRFFISYKKLIAGSIILAFCAIGTDLLLPHFLKLTIDKHLISSARKLIPSGDTEISFIKKHSHLLIPSNEQSCYFILPTEINNISRNEIKTLESTGVLIAEKFYFTESTPEKLLLTNKYNGLFIISDRFVFISYNNLPKLSQQDLSVIRAGDFKGIAKIALAFMIVLVCSFLFNFLQIYIVEYTSQQIMNDIRITIFNHIQIRSMSFFTKNPVGRLVTRATNDVQNLHEMFNALFANIFKDVILILGIFVILFILNWKLTLVCFSGIPLLIFTSTIFSSKSRKAFRIVRIKIAAINAMANENISGISVVKAFCRENINKLHFQKLNHENYIANMKQTIIFSAFSPVVDLTRFLAIALIIWYGGGETLRSSITLGTFVLFLYYMRMFFRPIQDLSAKYNIIHSAFASLERIYLLLNDKSTIPDSTRTKTASIIKSNIDFKNISFNYNKNEPVLKNVSFSVKPGETIAVVGPTGAGKTTIINLLTRLYDTQQGSISIDGIDIRKMEKSILRKHIAIVMQEVFLFAGTIKSNVTLGNKSFSDTDVKNALKTVNAIDFVEKLPKGINENVHEGGKTLSAGERQLLSFARAVLINPSILVLDEATSNIDPLTEGLIQNALEKLLRNTTSLVIAHRFSTIQKADRIIVLHKGRIHEQGTHEELLKKQDLYTKLYKLQYI